MERPSEQRRRLERRRLFDRRSPQPRRNTDERRGRDRRAAERLVARNRRAGSDRRRAERRLYDERRAVGRRVGPRRRDTPTPYTPEELLALRQRFLNPGAVACPACGASFELGLPRHRGDEIVRRVRCTGCSRAAVVSNTRVARILVIEQKDVIRDTLRSILMGAGHDVVEAMDAGVGLAAYEVSPPDVVFIDVHAAGRMDAGEFVRRLRKSFPDARIIAMAGRPSYGIVDPLAVTQRLGAIRTIRMPFSRAEVLNVVEEARP